MYCDGAEVETVAGSINLVMTKGKKIEHVGIKVELIGQIGGPASTHSCVPTCVCVCTRAFTKGGTELFYDRGNHFEFTSLMRELAPPGVLKDSEVHQPTH